MYINYTQLCLLNYIIGIRRSYKYIKSRTMNTYSSHSLREYPISKYKTEQMIFLSLKEFFFRTQNNNNNVTFGSVS